MMSDSAAQLKDGSPAPRPGQAERDLTRHDAAQPGKAKTEDRLQRERRRLALLHRSRQFLLSDEFTRVKAAGRR